MVYNLYQAIPSLEQQKPRDDSPYKQLVQVLTTIDWYAYQSHLTTNCYVETLVRYCYFFTNDPLYLPTVVDQMFT